MTLWCAPDVHASAASAISACALNARSRRAISARACWRRSSARPTLVIGTDCPALTPAHLQRRGGGARDARCRADPGRGRRLRADRRDARRIPACSTDMRLERAHRCWPRRARASPRAASRHVELAAAVGRRHRGRSRAHGTRVSGACALDCSRITTSPQTMSTAATMRTARSGSLSMTTAMTAPNSTLVSRKVATMAIGAKRHRP